MLSKVKYWVCPEGEKKEETAVVKRVIWGVGRIGEDWGRNGRGGDGCGKWRGEVKLRGRGKNGSLSDSARW